MGCYYHGGRGSDPVCHECANEAKAEGAAEATAAIVADLRQGAAYARKTPENVFALSIAHALEAAADRYEQGTHLAGAGKTEEDGR